MDMRFNLHKTKIADWNKPGLKRRNPWQKVAKKSNGTLTPGNFISILGAIIATYGLYKIVNGAPILGIALLALGRLFDLADGIIAEITGTKSPLGETIDATLDKIVLIAALILLFIENLVPALLLAAIALQSILNIYFSLLARAKRLELHPSSYGKLSTVAAWIALICYPMGNFAQTEELMVLSAVFLWVSYICFAMFAVLGFIASIDYGKKTLQKS